MYFLVTLKTAIKTTIIVPWKWVQSIDIVKLLNYGIRIQKNTEVLVYFSKNMQEEPDFHSNILNNFKSHKSACYLATIVRGFGECLIFRNLHFSVV